MACCPDRARQIAMDGISLTEPTILATEDYHRFMNLQENLLKVVAMKARGVSHYDA
jgi:hypothetical protein